MYVDDVEKGVDENLLLDSQNNIKIIDFGLAKHMEPEDKVGYFLSVLRIRIREDPN